MIPNEAIDTERQILTGLAPALDRLRGATGLKATIAELEPRLPDGGRADGWLDVEHRGGVQRYAVEAKNRVDRVGMLGHVKAQAAHNPYPVLLVAPHITNAIARECRKLDLPFIDLAGNAYLKLPDLYVYITGERPQPATGQGAGMAKPRGATIAALRIVFALLCKPDLLNAPYREIARAAGVALGNVGGVLADLEARGLITGKDAAGKVRFKEPTRLFQEWVTNYPLKLRPKLNPKRFRAERRDWWQTADLTGLPVWWGGEIAADRLTHYLKPATCTLYVRQPDEADAPRVLPRLAGQYRFRADPAGDIELLDAFWHFDTDTPDRTAPPILVYADLVATLDPRNIDTANKLREQYIDPALRQL